jgi:hypothetical protein
MLAAAVSSTRDSKDDSPLVEHEIMPIDRAPYRVRREYHRRERRNSLIAILVILVVVGLIAAVAWRLLGL